MMKSILLLSILTCFFVFSIDYEWINVLTDCESVHDAETASRPGDSNQMAVCTMGNYMYLYGGMYQQVASPSIPCISNEIWRLDLDALTWAKLNGTIGWLVPDYSGGDNFDWTNQPHSAVGAGMWCNEADDTLYIFGGTGSLSLSAFFNKASYNDLWQYDPHHFKFRYRKGPSQTTTNPDNSDPGTVYSKDYSEWNIPGSRHGHALHLVSINYALVFGGEFDNSVWKAYNNVWEYELSSNRWSLKFNDTAHGVYSSTGNYSNDQYGSGNVIPARSYAATWMISTDELYVFGGKANYRDNCYADLWVYSRTQADWKFIKGTNVSDTHPATLPEKMSWDSGLLPYAAAFFQTWKHPDDDDSLYLMGGGTVGNILTRNTMFEYSISDNDFRYIGGDTSTNLPVDMATGDFGSRKGAGAFIYNDEFLFFGGHTVTIYIHHGVWKYNNMTACNGITKYDPTVCNVRGKCRDIDQCECDEPQKYYGWLCEHFNCSNVAHNDIVNVCSGHGDCIDYNNCSCLNSSFTGVDCEEWDCWGTQTGTPGICNNHGDCIDLNRCSCNGGYYGANCEDYNCESLHYSDPGVCLGRGNCTEPNLCSCDYNYFDNNCQHWLCDGIPEDNFAVCNYQNGTCNKPDNCSCYADYEGEWCTEFKCWGYDSVLDDEVCNFRNGTCYLPNQCHCNAGYFGTICDEFKCDGVWNTNNTASCYGHGECVNVEYCHCDVDYSGQYCQDWDCYGDLRFDNAVCNYRNGSCIAHDQCACYDPYVGPHCDEWECYGKHKDTLNETCSGHGDCVLPDNCVCSNYSRYTGYKCQNWTCYGVRNDDLGSVCNGNGKCIDFNLCDCNSGYHGDKCSERLQNGQFNSVGTDITFPYEIDIDELTSTQQNEVSGFPCTDITSDTKIGIGNTCYFTIVGQKTTELRVNMIGNNPTIIPGDTIVFDPLTDDDLETLTVSAPTTPALPTLIISEATTICQNGSLFIYSSCPSGRDIETHYWELSDDFDLTSILCTYDEKEFNVDICSYNLIGGRKYTIQCTARTFLGGETIKLIHCKGYQGFMITREQWMIIGLVSLGVVGVVIVAIIVVMFFGVTFVSLKKFAAQRTEMDLVKKKRKSSKKLKKKPSMKKKKDAAAKRKSLGQKKKKKKQAKGKKSNFKIEEISTSDSESTSSDDEPIKKKKTAKKPLIQKKKAAISSSSETSSSESSSSGEEMPKKKKAAAASKFKKPESLSELLKSETKKAAAPVKSAVKKAGFEMGKGDFSIKGGGKKGGDSSTSSSSESD